MFILLYLFFFFFFFLAENRLFFFFFFFQAEDGIRDFHVTGVQTCALPISRRCRARRHCRAIRRARGRAPRIPARPSDAPVRERSEERRVGKECRSRWS